MINKLNYYSQHDSDATKSRNDCGATSLKMVLNTYGENLNTNQIVDLTGAGGGYISFQQLINVAKKYGYTGVYKEFQTIDSLKQVLDQGLCPIVLVQYGSLKSVQDKVFKGPHLFVVTGYRDDGYFVHDPNFWGDLRKDGENHFFTKFEFENAWNSTTSDGNHPRSLLIVYPKNPLPIQQPINMEDKKLADEMRKLRQHNANWQNADAIKKEISKRDDAIDAVGKELTSAKQLINKVNEANDLLETELADLRVKCQSGNLQRLIDAIAQAVEYLYEDLIRPVINKVKRNGK